MEVETAADHFLFMTDRNPATPFPDYRASNAGTGGEQAL